MKRNTVLLAIMASDLAAFHTKLAIAGHYEKREDISLKAIAENLEGIGSAFEQFKSANDARIKALEEGKSTAEFDAKLAKIEEHMTSIDEAKANIERQLARPGVLAEMKDSSLSPALAEHRDAFLAWTRNTRDPEREQRLARAQRAALETRAGEAITSTPGSGGYAVPIVVERAIARLGLDISPIRQLATVRTVGTQDYSELFDVGGAGFEWLGEGDTRHQTDTPDLVEISPSFGMASAKPQATEESLDDLFFDVQAWLVDSASEAISKGENIAFISGDGVKKPKGFLGGPAPVVTDDLTRAFGTLQYVPSGQAAALPTTLDAFTDMVYTMRNRYLANSKWLTTKEVMKTMRKYKDSTGQYLWQPSVVAGQPTMFLGYPVVEAYDMPAVAANSFPVAFGDFKQGYLVVDRVGMRMTRDEITTPGRVKFYIRKRVGGVLRNTQAIKLMKIAAA